MTYVSYPKTFAEAVIREFVSNQNEHAVVPQLQHWVRLFIDTMLQNPRKNVMLLRQLGIKASVEEVVARHYGQGSGPGEPFDATLFTLECAGWTNRLLVKEGEDSCIRCGWGSGYQVQDGDDWRTVLSNYDSSG